MSRAMTVQTGIEIDLPEGFLEAMATYDDDGALVSVQIGGWECPADMLAKMIGAEAFARVETLADDKLHELLEEAARDAAEDRADHQLRLRKDDGL